MSMTDPRSITKTCVKCEKDKNLTEFTKDSQKKTGLTPYCKACRKIMSQKYYENNKEKVNASTVKRYGEICHTKEYQDQRHSSYIKRAYGITTSDYNDMFIEQGGRCAICGKHQSESARRLVVDHCHDTSKIRGLLCHICNTGIGMFADNAQLLKNAIKYMEASK